MDTIHKKRVIVLVFGEVEVGMTRDVHTQFDDDRLLFLVTKLFMCWRGNVVREAAI